jgi:anti-sigma regulatory factor (Ser/Thr protein kinase)
VLSADPALKGAGAAASDAGGGWRAASPADLVVFDTASPPPESSSESSSPLAMGRAGILCHTLGLDPLIDLWAQYPDAYLLGKRGSAAAADLTRAMRARDGGAHGVKGFLRDGTTIVTVDVVTRADTDAAVAVAHGQAGIQHAFPDFADSVATGTMELLMNARRAAGDGVPVTLRCGADGQTVALSVTDPSGTLTRAVVLENVRRCAKRGHDQIRMTQGSAGLGLYMVLAGASCVEFRVTPGRATEVTFASHIHPTMKAFEAEPRSLHFLSTHFLSMESA